MKQKDILRIFQDHDALMEGHFLLSSGLHSEQYLQCARVLENPKIAEKLSRALAASFVRQKVNVVIGPAMGGIVLAYELARALGARALFAERESGQMSLRRGFCLFPQERVLIAEDVITTGGSVKEVIEAIKPYDVTIVGIAALMDRSNKKAPFGKIRFKSLGRINIKTYQAHHCPLCKKKVLLVKPGSPR